MATKKTTTTTQIDSPDPKRLDECGFFKRLGFKLSNEQKKLRDAIYSPDIDIIFCNAKAGSGKAQPKSTLIPTPEGDKLLGDLKIGDYIFDANGEPTKVLGIFDQGLLDAYEVVFSDGRKTICCGEHLWTHYNYFSRSDKDNLFTETLNSMLKRDLNVIINRGTVKRYSIPLCSPIKYEEKKFEIDPYVIGVFLGDGCCTDKYLTLSSADESLVAEVANICGFTYKRLSLKNYNWKFYKEGKIVRTQEFFKSFPTICRRSECKEIPTEYFYGSIEQRYALIQGLLDTDGSVNIRVNPKVVFTTTSPYLRDGIIKLMYSLGQSAVSDEGKMGKYSVNPYYTINLRIQEETKDKLFRLKRKRDKILAPKKDYLKWKFDRLPIKEINKLHQKYDMRCIYVDNPDHLYLTNDYIVTHNTTIAIATSCLMVECGLYNNIIYCFSLNNGFQSTLGLLPGGVEDKEANFYEPCLQALVQCGYQPEKYVKELNPEGYKNDSIFISCKSHTFLRGTNIDEKTILIVDEAQNFYLDELKKVLTRVKNGAKVIVLGHSGQNDIVAHPEFSGFEAYIDHFKNKEKVAICELTQNFRGWVSEWADNLDINKARKIAKKQMQEDLL